MRARPELVGASSGATDTDLMRLRDGWIAKGGAEGLFCAAHADGRGIALKAEDGAYRAIRPALGLVLGIEEFRETPVRNSRGEVVGVDRGRMKVFIVSDMEGVAGIVKWQQVTGGHAMYEEGRRLYTGEINAAVRGAKAAGATEIVVMDCHGAGEGLDVQLAASRRSWTPIASSSSRTNGPSTSSTSRAASTRRSSSACTRWPARATACSPTRSAARRGGGCGSTASRSARPGSTRRSAAPGAARSCSSPATRPPAAKDARCSAAA